MHHQQAKTRIVAERAALTSELSIGQFVLRELLPVCLCLYPRVENVQYCPRRRIPQGGLNPTDLPSRHP